MKIIIVTQDAPIYWPRFFYYFAQKFVSRKNADASYKNIHIEGVLALSPFKKRSILKEFKYLISDMGLSQFLKMLLVIGYEFLSIASDNFFYLYKKHPSTIKNICRRFNINLLSDKKINSVNSTDFINYIKTNDIDLIISAGAPEIFKKDILAAPKLFCVNIHTGYLPGYPGRKPLFWTMLNDEKYAAVTTHIMTDRVDEGPIILRKSFIIEKSDTLHSLTLKSMEIASDAIMETIDKIKLEGSSLNTFNNTDTNTPRKISPTHLPTSVDKKLFRQMGKKFY